MQRSFLMLSQEIRITGFLQETLAFQMDRKKEAPLLQGQVDKCSNFNPSEKYTQVKTDRTSPN